MTRVESGRAYTGRITVLGAGTMGQGIATAAIAAGLHTVITDVDPATIDRARAAISRRVQRRDGAEAVVRLLERLEHRADLEEAVAGASVVIEAAPEISPLKLDIFRRLAVAAPGEALLTPARRRESTSRRNCRG